MFIISGLPFYWSLSFVILILRLSFKLLGRLYYCHVISFCLSLLLFCLHSLFECELVTGSKWFLIDTRTILSLLVHLFQLLRMRPSRFGGAMCGAVGETLELKRYW